jgi:hypothetical protein
MQLLLLLTQGGAEVDGAIQAASGRLLLDECTKLNGCKVGKPKLLLKLLLKLLIFCS